MFGDGPVHRRAEFHFMRGSHKDFPHIADAVTAAVATGVRDQLFRPPVRKTELQAQPRNVRCLAFDGELTIALVVVRTVAALGDVLVQVLLPALETVGDRHPVIVAGLRRNSEIDGIEASMPLGAAVPRLLSFDPLIHLTAYGATRLILVCRPSRIALHCAPACPLRA